MTETTKQNPSLLTQAAIIGGFLVVAGFVVFRFTDLPSRIGLGQPSSNVSVQGQPGHEQADHDHSTDPAHNHAGDSHADHSHAADDHAGHVHAADTHVGHSEVNSISLSGQARANLGVRVEKALVGSFTKYVEIPGVVSTWPGRTHITVTSPMTGVVNAIHVVRGEQIASGTPLFTLRLTHEDLVKLQERFVAELGQLDVAEREIKRLASIARSGAVAGKTLITREYERDRLLANIRAVRQSLVLHGLTEQQVAEIESTRQLVREIIINAPQVHLDRSLHHDALPHLHAPDGQHADGEFLITSLGIDRGESVESGKMLVQLSDYSRLLIEGHAFQRDARLLQKVAESDAALQAVLVRSNDQSEIIEDLRISYIGNEVDRKTRALAFYVELDNEIERATKRDDRQFLSWRYKPGQRLKLRLPESSLENVIVVPIGAVAEEGADRFVFVDRGDHFDRVAVEIIARDSVNAAIARDGQILPGQKIAVSRAHQLHMAVKNKSGGGVDAHAGHNH